MEYLEPVYETEPSIRDYGDLFIKAEFTTNGYTLDGYLMGGESFYGFGLFVHEKEICFNFNLPSFFEENYKKIFQLMNCKPFLLFPMIYSSSVILKEKPVISGTFFPKE